MSSLFRAPCAALLYLLLTALRPPFAHADTIPPAPPVASSDAYRGWEYLAAKLIADGIPEPAVREIYGSPRMPRFTRVAFALNPRETHEQYGFFRHPSRLNEARACLERFAASFAEAERDFEVDKHVIAAIMLVETHCGRVTGDAPIIDRLSRMAGVGASDNLQFNYERLHAQNPAVTMDQVQARAAYLEATFYPEVLALVRIAAGTKESVFEYKGSYAGAFGLPQFLPSAYLKFGIDADHDGKVSLFSGPDAIASVANYLSSYGWRNDAPEAAKKQVVWKYNHSEAYVDTVMAIAAALDRPEVAAAPRQGSAPRKKKPAPPVEKEN